MKKDGHQTLTPDVSHLRNVEVTHETSDISVSGVLAFVVALTVITIAIYIGMWLLFGYFQKQEAKEKPPGPMALQKGERLPPAPRLQGAPGFGVTLENGQRVNLQLSKPAAEYDELNKEWTEALAGKLNDPSGKPVSMPISEAMKKIATEGLPARANSTPGKIQDFAVSVPTAASSGRVSEKRLQ
jgi:hypothetical protein